MVDGDLFDKLAKIGTMCVCFFLNSFDLDRTELTRDLILL
jgi:hypothetical protein